jgi:hypothetical protein
MTLTNGLALLRSSRTGENYFQSLIARRRNKTETRPNVANNANRDDNLTGSASSTDGDHPVHSPNGRVKLYLDGVLSAGWRSAFIFFPRAWIF